MNFKRLKFKVNNSVVVAFSVVFVILINILVVLLESKVPMLKLDLTENAITKISNETKSVLDSIDEGDEKFEIIYLRGSSDVNGKVNDVLEQYDAYCENITYRVENYHKNPLLLSNYGIDSSKDVDGSVIVTSEDRTKIRIVERDNMEISYNSSSVFLLENLLTNALGVVSSSDQMSVCFVTGHEENSSDMLISLLNNQNINVTQIDLSTASVPEDVDLLMIMAPQKDYTMAEIDAIDDYLLKGGNASVSLPFGIVLDRLETYLKSWGISANNDILLEQSPDYNYQGSGMYFYAHVSDHEAVTNLGNRILNSYARSIEFTKTGDIEGELLLETSSEGYSVPLVNGELDKENMKQGTYHLAYILEKPLNGSYETTSKMIVTSSTAPWGVADNIVTDYDYHVYYSLAEDSFGNSDFVMNMLSNVYGKNIENIYIPLKSRKVSILSISDSTAKVLQRVLCVVLPILVLCAGVVVWLKRRNK
ncbi:MAG: Gldg family protein [Clostridia bacterium]